jgi:hypothetical protein
LGHALFPTVALMPFALGIVFGLPDGLDPPVLRRELALRFTLIATAVLAILVHGVLAQWTGVLPFVGVCALGAGVGVAVRDLERRRTASLAGAAGSVAFLILLFLDFRSEPETAFEAFALAGGTASDAFSDLGDRYFKIATLLALPAVFLAFWERQPGLPTFPKSGLERSALGRAVTWVTYGFRRAFSRHFWGEESRIARDEYRELGRGYLEVLRQGTSNGWVWAALVVEVALVGGVLIHTKVVSVPFKLPRFPLEDLVYQLWLWPLVLAVPWGMLLLRDLTRAVFQLLPLSRPSIAVLGLSASGLVLSLGYYPALAKQISPKDVFDAYVEEGNGAPLSTLGRFEGTAQYYARGNFISHDSADRAFEWLMERPEERRFLVFGGDELPRLNASYRAHHTPASNLPILDASSGQYLLASNQLGGKKNQNPLESLVLAKPPAPKHALSAELGNELRVLGWDVREPDGEIVTTIRRRHSYEFLIYFEVLDKVTGNWEVFVHLDAGERKNLDHKLSEKYPSRHWQKGDVVVDVHPFEFSSSYDTGSYSVGLGLFSGKKRKPVTAGKHDDNRLAAGALVVR